MLSHDEWVEFPALQVRVRPLDYPDSWLFRSGKSAPVGRSLQDVASSISTALGPLEERLECSGKGVKGFIAKNSYLGRGWWWSCDRSVSGATTSETGVGSDDLVDSIGQMLESVYEPDGEA